MPEDLDIRKLFHKMEKIDASDLHIKIGSPPVLRIASDLHEVKMPPLSEEQTKALLDPIVPEHLKQKLADEGGLDFSHMEGSAHRYRCSIFHAGGGIHAAIRRVNPKSPGFKELNLPDVYERVARTSHEGLVIVCGVTGCGKSTTLAAMVDYINHTRRCNIITVEDPVEYQLQGIGQIQVSPRVGLTFASGLRSILRQDPDVIMVGEIRDRETAEIAVQASLTGHLVLSTLHTNDAASAVARLLEMGVEPYLAASSLMGALAQRLVRNICPHCKEEYKTTPSEAAYFKNGTNGLKAPATLWRGKGCDECNHTGYLGRIALFEQANRCFNAVCLYCA
ncbi:MAG: ATPase, T2SS/T4P/T4SS family [Dehalococcoidia bacterium]